jgi:branched-chain amino acid transport system substrate-binding protein
MPKILISYRRADSAGIAGRIFDRLVARYDESSVFIDVDNIPFGTDFREHIGNSLLASDVILVVIGARWLGPQADGRFRIRDDSDPVRIEIEAALKSGLPIIPVLVDGASMPQANDLPGSIVKLAYLNAATLDAGREFHHQMDRLIKSIERIVAARAAALAGRTADSNKAPHTPPPETKASPTPADANRAATTDSRLGSPATPPRVQRKRIVLATVTASAVSTIVLLGLYFGLRTPDTATSPTSVSTVTKSPSLPASPPVVSALPPQPTPQPAPIQQPAALPPPSQPPSIAPLSGPPIRMGMAGPLTGPNAAFGAQIKNGTEQAVEDINAAGGILGRRIVLSYGDDESDPKQGVSVANRFAGEGVQFVIGHFNSGVTLPASEVYQANGILEITPSATNPKITERDMWNIFRTCGRDDQQGTFAGNYILALFRGRKIALVHDKTTYGQGLAEDTRRAIQKGGMREVLFEGVNVGDKDFSTLVSKIKASGADLVYWGGLHTEGGLIVRQMRSQGIKAVFMAADGITTDEFASIGGPGVEGTLMTFSPDPRTQPAAKAVVERFRAKRFEPEAYTLYSYAAVEVIKQAAEQARSLDPRKVAEIIKSGKRFRTVVGEFSYDWKGDVTRLDYVMYVWKKDPSGKITYVEQ